MTNIKIPRPLHDEVFILPDQSINKPSAIIEMVKGSEQKADRGTVLAVGPGKIHSVQMIDGKIHTLRAEMSVTAQDYVYYSKHAGYTQKFDGHDVIVLRDGDLMGVD